MSASRHATLPQHSPCPSCGATMPRKGASQATVIGPRAAILSTTWASVSLRSTFLKATFWTQITTRYLFPCLFVCFKDPYITKSVLLGPVQVKGELYWRFCGHHLHISLWNNQLVSVCLTRNTSISFPPYGLTFLKVLAGLHDSTPIYCMLENKLIYSVKSLLTSLNRDIKKSLFGLSIIFHSQSSLLLLPKRGGGKAGVCVWWGQSGKNLNTSNSTVLN